jgi:hypothetical protein
MDIDNASPPAASHLQNSMLVESFAGLIMIDMKATASIMLPLVHKRAL